MGSQITFEQKNQNPRIFETMQEKVTCIWSVKQFSAVLFKKVLSKNENKKIAYFFIGSNQV